MPHSDPGSHYAVSSGYSSSGYSSSSASSSAASSAGYNSGYNSSASSATSSPTSDGDRLQRAFTTAAVAQRRPKMPQRNTSWSLMPQSERRSAPPLGRVKSKLKGGMFFLLRWWWWWWCIPYLSQR